MIHRESIIHLAVRNHLRSEQWELIAGQFPGGSDDELRRLYVRDPLVACDNSPDPRRHSSDTDVPDLVAKRATDILIVEMKPRFDPADGAKVLRLIHERAKELRAALEEFMQTSLACETVFRGALGFSLASRRSPIPRLAFLLVRDLETVIEDPAL